MPDLVPTDITIRGNYLTKPLSWRGSPWTVKNLLELLLTKNRFSQCFSVCAEYQRLFDDHLGRVRAQLISAEALDSGTLERLRSALERRLGKEILVTVQEDPSLLAGTIAKVGSVVYDGSLRTQLEDLRQAGPLRGNTSRSTQRR